MLVQARSILFGICAASALSACGVSSMGSSAGTSAVAAAGAGSGGSSGGAATGNLGRGGEGGSIGTHDTIVATPPVAGVFSVVVGSKQTASITFNSSDGKMMTGFGVANGLGAALPAGWSGPATFGCASLSTGSGCVLNLRYAPTAYNAGGTITLHYIYVDDDMEPNALGDSMSFDFKATTHDNIVAAVLPIGQINATVNSTTQMVNVTFTTDDGHPASNFAITSSASALPAGWSAPSSTSCATISAGAACQMTWVYTPTAPDMGTIRINYSFADDSGTPQSSSFNIPYAATAKDNAVATVAPPGPIALVAPASQPVAVTFTTDDTFTASNLMVTTDLTMLPPGWSAASQSFACAAFGAGSGCQLGLTYAPTGADLGGVLQLTYDYFDNAGEAKTGAVNIGYAATARDNAIAVVAPSASISVASPASQAVTVTFTTSDGFAASNLSVDLSMLPPYWSAAGTSFTCASFSTGISCRLNLTYAPTAADPGGTLPLNYGYTDDAGDVKTGTVAILYSAS